MLKNNNIDIFVFVIYKCITKTLLYQRQMEEVSTKKKSFLH